MANEIKDLKGFMEAAKNHHDAIIKRRFPNIREDMSNIEFFTFFRLREILSDEINEAEYIAKWVKE